jgi:dienelactone hydrolase
MKCPAVVVIQDWNGMNSYEKERANMLADMGYVGFAADIYGIGTPVENMFHWMAASSAHRGNATLYMAKIEAALTKVKSFDFVDTAKIAVIGYCFGGTGIVNMAILGSDVLGVVGYHSGIANTSRVQVSQTQPRAITAKVLLHSGAMDDKATDIAQLEQEFERANATYEIMRFGKKVFHSFTDWKNTPGIPGMAVYDARADYRSWESTKLFLTELFSSFTANRWNHAQDFGLNQTLMNYSCGGSTCQGFLAYHPTKCTGSTKCPAVVVIHGWKGVTDYEKERTKMLADFGYVGFAADIYGFGTPVENMQHWIAASSMHRGNPALYMSKITAALDKVKTLNNVDATKIAVIGYCFGGTGIVNMALMGSDVLGVVGYHSGLTQRVMFNKTKPMEVKTKVLMHSGVMDDAATNVAALEQDFEAANATYEIARYGKQVFHSFTDWANTPGVPGMAVYNERADYRSWESTKLFLAELFNGMPQPARGHSVAQCARAFTCPNGQKPHGTDKSRCVTTSMAAATTTTGGTTSATAATLDTSKLAGTASFTVLDTDVDLIVNNQSRKDAMKEGFAVAINVPVNKFTKFEVTKHMHRRLDVEQAPVRQLAGPNVNVAYTIDLTGLANKTEIVADAKLLTKDTLQKKVQEKLSAVGYTGTIKANDFTAAHPTMTSIIVSVNAAFSANVWMAAIVALFQSFL